MSKQDQNPHQPRPSGLGRWIEDPFGSIYAGLIAQAATLTVLFAGMFGLSQIA
jgi:hypothetical protein